MWIVRQQILPEQKTLSYYSQSSEINYLILMLNRLDKQDKLLQQILIDAKLVLTMDQIKVHAVYLT